MDRHTLQTEFGVSKIASSDKRQLFKRRDVGTFRRRLSIVGNSSCYWVTNYDQQSNVWIHQEDALYRTTADQVTGRLLDRQLTGSCCWHARPTYTNIMTIQFQLLMDYDKRYARSVREYQLPYTNQRYLCYLNVNNAFAILDSGHCIMQWLCLHTSYSFYTV